MTWRSVRRDDRQIAVLWAACAVGLLVLRPVWLAAAGLAPPCLWHLWTGVPCPGCGTTRALMGLLRGEPRAAFGFNPLVASGAIVFVAGGLAGPLWLAAGGRIPAIESRPRPAWGALAALAVIANWIWLVVSGV